MCWDIVVDVLLTVLLNFKTIMWDRYYYSHTHFKDEEAKVQRN